MIGKTFVKQRRYVVLYFTPFGLTKNKSNPETGFFYVFLKWLGNGWATPKNKKLNYLKIR